MAAYQRIQIEIATSTYQRILGTLQSPNLFYNDDNNYHHTPSTRSPRVFRELDDVASPPKQNLKFGLTQGINSVAQMYINS